MHTEHCYKSLLILVISFGVYVHSDIREECSNKPNNAFIFSNTSCSHYIYCAGEDSYEGECPDGDYFNELLQTCDPRHLVDCKLNAPVSISEGMWVAAQAQTPTTLSPLPYSTVKTPSELFTTSLTNFSISDSDVPSSTTITTAIYSAQENDNITSFVGVMFTTTTVAPNINGDTGTMILVSTACPAMDNPSQIIFVPHPKSCSDYFICYHGERLAMHCSSMLHFNVNTGKCDYPEIVRCQTDFSNPREQCQLHTIDLYPHTTNCNYFYYCRNGYLLLQQCPFGYGWDFEKRACTMLRQAICYNRRNR